MGGEFAQEREWNHDRALDWHLAGQDMHAGVRRLIGDHNRLYRQMPALHARDCTPDGFEWIDASNAEMSVLCFLRKGGDGRSEEHTSELQSLMRISYAVF